MFKYTHDKDINKIKEIKEIKEITNKSSNPVYINFVNKTLIYVDEVNKLQSNDKLWNDAEAEIKRIKSELNYNDFNKQATQKYKEYLAQFTSLTFNIELLINRLDLLMLNAENDNVQNLNIYEKIYDSIMNLIYNTTSTLGNYDEQYKVDTDLKDFYDKSVELTENWKKIEELIKTFKPLDNEFLKFKKNMTHTDTYKVIKQIRDKRNKSLKRTTKSDTSTSIVQPDTPIINPIQSSSIESSEDTYFKKLKEYGTLFHDNVRKVCKNINNNPKFYNIYELYTDVSAMLKLKTQFLGLGSQYSDKTKEINELNQRKGTSNDTYDQLIDHAVQYLTEANRLLQNDKDREQTRKIIKEFEIISDTDIKDALTIYNTNIKQYIDAEKRFNDNIQIFHNKIITYIKTKDNNINILTNIYTSVMAIICDKKTANKEKDTEYEIYNNDNMRYIYNFYLKGMEIVKEWENIVVLVKEFSPLTDKFSRLSNSQLLNECCKLYTTTKNETTNKQEVPPNIVSKTSSTNVDSILNTAQNVINKNDKYTIVGGGKKLVFPKLLYVLEQFTKASINTMGLCNTNPNCNDIYDLTTGTVYTRDKDGNVLYKDGREVKNWLDDDKCFGLGEFGGDCNSLAVYLLSGDIKNLNDISDNVLDKLTKNVSNMNPGTIEQILKTFSVKTENGPRGQVPTSLEYWGNNTLKSLVSNEKRIEILKNVKLLKFLKTVIEYAQKYPEILEVNKKIDKTIDNKRKHSLVPSFIPIPMKDCRKYDEMYRTALNDAPRIYNPLLGRVIPGAIPVPMNQLSPVGIMIGGGGDNLEPTARLLNSMYNNVLLKFERSGCSLNQQDKDKIKCAIEKLSRLETSLQKKLIDLNTYSEIERNCTGNMVSMQDIKDRDIQRLKESVSNMTNDVNSNLYKQSNIISLFMGGILKQLAGHVQ